MQTNNRLKPLAFGLINGSSGNFDSSVIMNNRLESLKVFSNLILQEIETLRREGNLSTAQNINLSEEVQNYEAELIRCALLRCNGRQRKAAKLLGVKATTLNSKIKRLGIEIFQSNRLLS